MLAVSYNAFLGHAFVHSKHKMHSVPFLRFLELSVMSTFIGHTFLHLPQEMHLLSSHLMRNREKWDIGFKNTVIGHMYLQKARLSFSVKARIIPTV